MSIERTAEDTKQFHAFLERQATKPAQGHTPGPWVIHDTDVALEIHPSNDDDGLIVIADVYGGDTDAGQANARLIKAAPDLLAMCKASLLAMDGQGQICVELRAAITKATKQ